jgi:hypothetical protein
VASLPGSRSGPPVAKRSLLAKKVSKYHSFG